MKTAKTLKKANRKTAKLSTRRWSLKYKRSIDCTNPKGFSQKQHCKYGRKTMNNQRLKC
jgi:hypothetical protein